jgi:hypothetical protein
MNHILKILFSLPIIIVVGYFLPFIGVCLIIMRYFVYSRKKYFSTSVGLIIIGVLILIPISIKKVLELVPIKSVNIPYLDMIISSDIYPNLLNYSKFLISVGIVFLIISLALRKLIDKISNYLKTFISAREQIDAENRSKNDIEMKIKQEKAKNTQVVHCPHCGADNILTESGTNCKYCRRSLSLKEQR